MLGDVGRKLLKTQLGRSYQVADKANRVFEDHLERRAKFLEVRHRAGCDNFKDDLQKRPDGRAGPIDKFSEEGAEYADDLCEAAWKQNDIFPVQRLQRVEEHVRKFRNEMPEVFDRGLKPFPGTIDGVGLLDIGPYFFLADELHETTDYGLRAAVDRLAGDRILAENGEQEGPIPACPPPASQGVSEWRRGRNARFLRRGP